MDVNQMWVLGLVIGLICMIPVVAAMVFADHPKFAGPRQKLAALATRILPFAVIDAFEHVYGSKRVMAANKKALLEAKKRGQARAKALRHKESH